MAKYITFSNNLKFVFSDKMQIILNFNLKNKNNHGRHLIEKVFLRRNRNFYNIWQYIKFFSKTGKNPENVFFLVIRKVFLTKKFEL